MGSKSIKHLVTTLVFTLAALFVINRVAFLRNIVAPPPGS